jgi:MoaA/NifB/PqqE/SkfB family radical SAM enzyme
MQKTKKPIDKFLESIGISKKSDLKLNGDTFYFFGDFDELDDRITSKKSGNYSKKMSVLKGKINKFEHVRIVIGISRYNFFKLHKIAQECLNLFPNDHDLNWIKLKTFPLSSLVENFNNYLKEICSQLPKYIKLEMHDKKLEEILVKVQELSLHKTDSDGELARLLGVITEYAFVGPRVMVIDPHHRCNTNCTHCWVHTPGVSHSKNFLDLSFPMDRFKKMIDDAADLQVETIILQGDGEPLLHPHSLDMLRYARKKGLDVRFFTNGILLTERIAKAVVEIGVKEIYVSFPAGSRETYKIINPIQKPETYDLVVKNLKRLMEIKRKAKAKYPRVIVTHVIHTQNHHELVKMAKDDVYEKVDAARFYLIRLDVMNKFLQIKSSEFEKIKEQIPQVEKILKKGNVEFVDNVKFQLENYDKKDGSWCSDVFLKKGCTIGYYFNLVPAKGDMSFCCHLRTVGNLKEKSFKDIWNSDQYRKWRYQGKYMDKNMDAKFLNDQLLYDEHCTHCDNHQTILESYEKLKKYDLWEYYK